RSSWWRRVARVRAGARRDDGRRALGRGRSAARELHGVGVAELREHLVQTPALLFRERAARLLLEHVQEVDRPARLIEVLLDLAAGGIGEETEVHHARGGDHLHEQVERRGGKRRGGIGQARRPPPFAPSNGSSRRAWNFAAASTNERKSGCGSVGLLWNS